MRKVALTHRLMPNETFKQAAHSLIEQLPDPADWDALIYRAVVRRSIERGLADSVAGLVVSPDEVLAELTPDDRR